MENEEELRGPSRPYSPVGSFDLVLWWSCFYTIVASCQGSVYSYKALQERFELKLKTLLLFVKGRGGESKSSYMQSLLYNEVLICYRGVWQKLQISKREVYKLNNLAPGSHLTIQKCAPSKENKLSANIRETVTDKQTEHTGKRRSKKRTIKQNAFKSRMCQNFIHVCNDCPNYVHVL